MIKFGNSANVWSVTLILVLVVGFCSPSFVSSAQAQTFSCNPPAVNPIVCENSKPGNSRAEWDIDGAGDWSIQGFATDISVNQGETVHFKINTDASFYEIYIYRMGYYDGSGARLIATVLPSVPLPQYQPACLRDTTTGLVDCGNWSESASWSVPPDAVSGIYFAKLVRPDTGGASHIMFVIRADGGGSDLLFQTSDTTWQAYNSYGGNSLYRGLPVGRAYKVSYNRPFFTRNDSDGSSHSWVFGAEYPMVRWLEANGYNVSYFTGLDSDRIGAEILEHKVFLSVGHDEYWSGAQRANVEAARDAGVHLAFFSGNEVFWKTRWENSIDGSNTPYRTLVCYKETQTGHPIDPSDPPTWTGTWRDPRFSPPADGGRPENALTGTLFRVNGVRNDAIEVPASFGYLRFWRNTGIATLEQNTTATFPAGTLGYEWDESPDNGFRPAGLIELSATTLNIYWLYLLDYGSTYGSGTATHHLTLYRAGSGALVFGAGTVQWSWGLDDAHDNVGLPPDQDMRQATVNLLADMNVQPSTLQSGLVPAAASTDTVSPASIINSPAPGSSVEIGNTIAITGTATDDGGGTVAGVEISVDGGTSWHRAAGLSNWNYTWMPGVLGTITLMSRAVDDSGNLEIPSAGITLTGVPSTTPISLWTSAAVPAVASQNDTKAVEVGIKFRSDIDGYIVGLRFYKGNANTGTHVGNLWTGTGTLLQSATFTDETASGWQEVTFAEPVAVTADTVYVASYHTNAGGYAVDSFYFAGGGYDNAPLHALASGVSGGNGVYAYGATSTFPTKTYQSTNYWVDVLFATLSPPTVPPTISSVQAPDITGSSATITWTTDKLTDSYLEYSTEPAYGNATSYGDATSYGSAYVPTLVTDHTMFLSGLAINTLYHYRVLSRDVSGNLTTSDDFTFTTTDTVTLWTNTAVPAVASQNDTRSVEVGVKFRSDMDGYIVGLRFYKGSANTGTHVGNLWTGTGTLLQSATFTDETVSGWQQVTFAEPVAVTADTIYVASYHTNVGGYAVNLDYFATVGYDNGPLHALASGISGGNGVYAYGATSTFPTKTYQSTNYWVDVLFATIPPPTVPPTISAVEAPDITGSNATITWSTDKRTDSYVEYGTTTAYGSSTAIDPTLVTNHTMFLSGLAMNTLYHYRVMSRDVSGNLTTSADSTFTTTNTVTLWTNGAVPAVASQNDTRAVEVGVKFRSDKDGYIVGLRFYKGSANTGTHVGNLWTGTGTLLQSATFTDETVSGWQQVTFAEPVAVTADTVYVASYHTDVGGYAANLEYFVTAGYDNGPLHALANGVSGGNGVYAYGTTGTFPTNTFNASNYWVDVVFAAISPPTVPPTISAVQAVNITSSSATITWTTDKLTDGYVEYWTGTSYDSTFVPALVTDHTIFLSGLMANTLYHYRVTSRDISGNLTASADFTFTTAKVTVSLWTNSAVPAVASQNDTKAAEVGVKFRSDVDGYIIGLRFYKGSANTGTHVGNLWTGAGTLLQSATFTNETASGWQQVTFAEPVAITADTVYVASYHTDVGRYSLNSNYFTGSGYDNAPLHAPASGVIGGNGVYAYGANSIFPTKTYQSGNYWVDVIFTTTP